MIVLAFAFALAAPTDIDAAFQRLYNFDFAGAHRILDGAQKKEPDNPLVYSVRAAAYLFSELDRLQILATDFFADDEKIIDKKKLSPDPALRVKFFQAVDEARKRATARLAAKPDDQEALFAMCMSASTVTDYTALVERRQWRSVGLAKQTNFYAQKLLALKPPFVDAHLAVGTVEYVIGSMPFFIRWLVRFDKIEGSKEKGIENVKQVVQNGRYYGPFGRILLSVAYLREKRPAEAQAQLAEFARQFPENPLVRKELEKVNKKLAAKH